ncbi:MAG: hypothetical protein GXP40_08695 [Chloroflexi bacterium]|nr:hypothetical protein [Chloroflexota bacterium]
MSRKPRLFAIILGCCIVVAGLILFAYMGFYNRYWADDWCYNNDFHNLGFWKTLNGYMSTDATRGYSTNRYSLTLFSGLLYSLGIPGIQILPMLTILFWLGGIFWVLYNLSRLGQRIPTSVLFLASALLLYYNLYISPQRFQILYWRSGILPYSTAIIFGLYILGIITDQMTEENTLKTKTSVFLVAPLSFLAGGFSETSCAYLVSGAILLFGATWWGKEKQQTWAKKAFPSAATALSFLVLAMIVLIISPSNARYDNMGTRANNPILVPFLSITYAFDFIKDSFKSLPIPHFIFLLCFLLLPGVSRVFMKNKQTFTIKQTTGIVAFTAIITFFLVVAVQAPSTYFYSTPIAPRGQSLSRFSLLAGIAVIAWTIGNVIADRLTNDWIAVLSIVLLFLGYAYTARSIVIVSTELPGFVKRAHLWDERDAFIRNAQERGIGYVEVKAIDTYEIKTRDMVIEKP